jgi:hypothetical protein
MPNALHPIPVVVRGGVDGKTRLCKKAKSANLQTRRTEGGMCWKCLEDEKGCWPHVALHDRLQHCQHRYRAAPLKTGRCVGLLNITLDGIDEVTGNSPSL